MPVVCATCRVGRVLLAPIVVERSLAWPHRTRRLLVRHERRADLQIRARVHCDRFLGRAAQRSNAELAQDGS